MATTDRYISPDYNFTLFNNKGERKFQFRNGLYTGDIGAPTINPAAAGYKYELQAVRADQDGVYDILGTQIATYVAAPASGVTDAQKLEAAGLGYLDGIAGDVASGKLAKGYKGGFFKANGISGVSGAAQWSSASGWAGLSGVWYEVLEGNCTYNGKTYLKGEIFKDNGTNKPTTTLTGSVVALTIPPALRSTNNEYRAEHFRIAKLKDGDETLGYGSQYSGGFAPNTLNNVQ